MKGFLVFLVLGASLLGCAMVGSWKAIPPPGGCDQCHQVPISHDWSVTVAPVALSDESGVPAWQQPTSVLPPEPSTLEQQKITEQRCFRCHKGPDRAHTQYKGRYHH
ncbi:cytochrome C [Geoalkalibacter sp.]|uniref:cytochrome C n=1 Tax=Geoalkalibacter sp. TaxID=3041440 RepID=UPI00272EDB14|nr:cytochrome C [Geoalkalibacter sp.]